MLNEACWEDRSGPLKKTYLKNFDILNTSWVCRPTQEDRINRKPEDLKNDQGAKNAKNHTTEKMKSIVLNLIFVSKISGHFKIQDS